MQETNRIIREYIHDLSEIPQTDPLVCVHTSNSIALSDFSFEEPFNLTITDELTNQLRHAQQMMRESDINPICLIHVFLEWELKEEIVKTPCFLIPLDFKIDKVTNKISFTALLDKAELNPFIRFTFFEKFEESLPTYTGLSFDAVLFDLKQRINTRHLPVKLIEGAVIGNFHYNRFHLLRELEGIIRSAHEPVLLDSFLGNNDTPLEPISFPTDLLTPADTDQIKVFEVFKTTNVVVQGPPGTGKSQVLTNMLGKNLSQQLKTLVLSEKKVALEVLVKKMASVELDAFTFIVHSQTKASDLVNQLKSTWNFLEALQAHSQVNLRLSEQRLLSLQLLMDRLNQVDLIGGISIEEFDDLANETPFQNAQIITNVPLVSEWMKVKKTLSDLQIKWGDFFALKGFKPSFFKEFNGDVIIKDLLQKIQILAPLLENGTWGELKRLEMLAGKCQLVENESFKLYTQINSKPRERKRFENSVTRFAILNKILEDKEKELVIWKQVPTKSQIDSWEIANGFWDRRKRTKAIKNLLKDHSVNETVALESWKEWWKLKTEFNDLSTSFLEWGVTPTLVHVESSWLIFQSLAKENESSLSELAAWSSDKRKSFIQQFQILSTLKNELQRFFIIRDDQNLKQYLEEKRRFFEQIGDDFKTITLLPDWIFALLDESSTIDDIQALVLKGNRAKTIAFFPELARFTGSDLQSKLEQIQESEDEEFQLFAAHIIFGIKERFDAYEQLLRIPSAKLKGTEKDLRARLKRGKALLVKEFGKTRNHLSIRSFLESDASEWIQLLLPIWLSTPNQVADNFPLKMDLFDVLIVDEASQMPLPNVFGSMYRSKRAIIAGDDQQMSPSTFFGKKLKGHDVLHQANYSFKRVVLKHHYRSAYPDLISFSNKHFYNNELIVYPSVHPKQALFHHYIKDGAFEDRKNEAEAKAVAAFLEKLDFNQSIGIVAFSEEQLKCIWKHCSSSVQSKIIEGQDQDTLFFKPLEQVQGEEATILVISMAYGKNNEGDFHKRFGPLNQEGGYKRLNVLFTRAKNEFHFFCSVTAADFSISTNESINLLRLFLHELEHQSLEQPSISLPYGIDSSIQKGVELDLKGIYKTITSSPDLVTFYRLMKMRGWKLNF